MGADFTLPAHEYVMFDSKGITGFKDGKEFPISEEDYKKAHPEHRNTDCKECTFVSDAEALLTYNVGREQRASANHRPLFVGMFTMPRWSGHSGFYLFKCQSCGNICVDYPQGYTGSGHIYLRCDYCQYQIVLTPREHGGIYEREKVVAPASPWRGLWALFINRKKIRALKP